MNSSTTNKPFTAYDMLVWLAELHGTLWSIEKPCLRASKSEIRRWFLIGSVEINFETSRDPNEVIDYPIVSVVIHPKSTGTKIKNGVERKRTHRNTLWFNRLEKK